MNYGANWLNKVRRVDELNGVVGMFSHMLCSTKVSSNFHPPPSCAVTDLKPLFEVLLQAPLPSCPPDVRIFTCVGNRRVDDHLLSVHGATLVSKPNTPTTEDIALSVQFLGEGPASRAQGVHKHSYHIIGQTLLPLKILH